VWAQFQALKEDASESREAAEAEAQPSKKRKGARSNQALLDRGQTRLAVSVLRSHLQAVRKMKL
jgi:hypothetical protein